MKLYETLQELNWDNVLTEDVQEDSKVVYYDALCDALRDKGYKNMSEQGLDDYFLSCKKEINGITCYVTNENADGDLVEEPMACVELEVVEDFAYDEKLLDELHDRFKKALKEVSEDLEKAKKEIKKD